MIKDIYKNGDNTELEVKRYFDKNGEEIKAGMNIIYDINEAATVSITVVDFETEDYIDLGYSEKNVFGKEKYISLSETDLSNARIEISTSDNNKHLQNTFSIVSTVAYLDGTPEKIFQNENEPPKIEYFNKLEEYPEARIIRSLSILRTSIEAHFKEINNKIYYDLKNLHTLPEYIPQDTIKQLKKDGIDIIKANYKLNSYLIDINTLICQKINDCKHFFPKWIEWNYIKDLFIMPDGLTENGVKKAAAAYYVNKNRCPYQVYLNWESASDCGNILYNDKKFCEVLYASHFDAFTDYDKVKDASEKTKERIYEYLAESKKTSIIVDCENSDPYRLYAVLKGLDKEALLSKICKIDLIDDIHTASAWDILKRFTKIPLEHIETERIVSHKSLVDPVVAIKVCTEFYENNIDSVLLFSSDSDYWSLYQNFTKVNYFVMAEKEKMGNENRRALTDAGIPYCYIDDFCTGNSDEIKIDAMLFELREGIKDKLKLNVKELFSNALTNTRATFNKAEEDAFIKRYIDGIRIVKDEDGNLSLELGK